MKRLFSSALLESLDPKALDYLIADYIKEKDYDNLTKVINVITPSHAINSMYNAIARLDIQAFRIILPQIRIEELFLDSYIDSWISVTVATELMKGDRQDRIKKKGQILQELISFKIKNIDKLNTQNIDIKIDKSLIIVLAQYLSMKNFDAFLRDKSIDLSTFDFSTTDICCIPSLLFKDAKQIVQSGSKHGNFIQTLSSRTYTTDFAKDNIFSAYNNLLTCEITKKIVDYIVDVIIKGDQISIIFAEDVPSCYSLTHAFICINTYPDLFLIEAIIAHEFTHYVMDKRFSNACLPFKDDNLRQATHDNKGIKRKKSDEISTPEKYLANIEQQYDEAAQPLCKFAAELISVKSTDLKSFKTTEEILNYLEDFTILPIFYLEFYDKYAKTIKQQLDEVIDTSPEIQIVMLKIIKQLKKLPFVMEDHYQDLDLNKNTALNCILKHCLPKIKSDLQLTEEHSFFLGRIAEIMVRPFVCCGAELLALYIELAIINHIKPFTDPNIMQICDQMEIFWQHNIDDTFQLYQKTPLAGETDLAA